MDYVQMVKEFYAKHNLPVPEAEILKMEPARFRKRTRLMTEEVGELVCAMDEHNIVEIADACADLIYVVAGTAAALGIGLGSGSSFEEYRRSHPTRGRGQLITDNIIVGHATALVASLNSLLEVLRFGGNTKTAFRPIMNVIFSIAVTFDIPLNECYEEVHRSNMTKTLLDKHSKGGKGEGYEPPNLQKVLHNYKFGKMTEESIG